MEIDLGCLDLDGQSFRATSELELFAKKQNLYSVALIGALSQWQFMAVEMPSRYGTGKNALVVHNSRFGISLLFGDRDFRYTYGVKINGEWQSRELCQAHDKVRKKNENYVVSDYLGLTSDITARQKPQYEARLRTDLDRCIEQCSSTRGCVCVWQRTAPFNSCLVDLAPPMVFESALGWQVRVQ